MVQYSWTCHVEIDLWASWARDEQIRGSSGAPYRRSRKWAVQSTSTIIKIVCWTLEEHAHSAKSVDSPHAFDLSGSVGREAGTERGVVYVTEALLANHGKSLLNQTSFVIQSFAKKGIRTSLQAQVVSQASFCIFSLYGPSGRAVRMELIAPVGDDGRAATDPDGRWIDLPPIARRRRKVWIRECYEDLYADMRELASLGKSYIHISGNPGIGKSCFLWYVLKRLLSEEGIPAVIVQLVEKKKKRVYIFKPDGSYAPSSKEDYEIPGAWLLTDQEFVGNFARHTVLFASPEERNWVDALKLINARGFFALYMPPWSVEELQQVYFSAPENADKSHIDFWATYYIAGPIVRYYFMPLELVYNMIGMAVNHAVKVGELNIYRALFLPETSVSWPSLDFTCVDHISFTSEWVVDCFAIACYKGQIEDWMECTRALPSLQSAAWVLFERYAHHRLSQGGHFCSIDDDAIGLHLEKRDVKFFSGNSLNLQVSGLHYLQPSSMSFPPIDSLYPPLVLFHISTALKQRAMNKSDYDALCSSLMAFRREHPDVPSGLQGVKEEDQVYAVLVKMEGGKSLDSEPLCVVEDVPDDQPLQQQSKKRARSPEWIKKEETPERKKKRTYLPFQMTIALKMQDHVNGSISCSTIEEIFDIVRSRMDGTFDTGGLKFGDMSRKSGEAKFPTVLMRGGKGSVQCKEMEDGVTVFGVSIEAVRTTVHTELKEETALSIKCTAGKLAGKELTIFVNERLRTHVMSSLPAILNMDTQRLGVLTVPGIVFQFSWSGDTADVLIRSKLRTSTLIKFVFPIGRS
ncbi:uncharacterized protein LOC9639656 [Selaginella moellendorffii]|uniref:uncharacterized protein LOC9639656 n=1 Tax=Selaginella moellendorffii TaxID=88036 RepID=UPI000D1C983F|nr:uncharacterized protein LOC9639656 [Selaginella moellendorffii]|eukprot:XP_024521041.1 uncharacterized protein LOC9639656 [Selaginella moellendorffii]